MRKRFITVIISFGIILSLLNLTGCGTRTMISGDYPYYPDVESIIQNSDIIILGDVVKTNKAEKININLDKEKAKLNREQDLLTYTVSEVKVKEVIKGNIKKDDIVKVKQRGDENGIADEEIIKNGGYFKEKGEHVFFLQSYEDIIHGMPYSLLNPIQGRIDFKDDKAKIYKDNKLFKDGAEKNNIIKEIKDKVDKAN
ncbi:MAG: hypothetical protein N3I35_11090 [Clostridia bacterium]|nr:hypothetical protein [Clostridia bacterium]